MDNVIIMKYGIHAKENIDNIIIRKTQEIEKNGYCFWGYGGTLLHPLNQVQPFCKNKEVYLLLIKTNSKLNNKNIRAKYYSIDSKTYSKIPENINVYGSSKALVFKDLIKYDKDIDLNKYEVAIGNSKGKNAIKYLQYRVDKGCFKKIKNNQKMKLVHVDYIAKLVYPYSVFIKEEQL